MFTEDARTEVQLKETKADLPGVQHQKALITFHLIPELNT